MQEECFCFLCGCLELCRQCREAVLLCKVIPGSKSLLAYDPAISWALNTVRADSQPTVYFHTHKKSEEKKDEQAASLCKWQRI